MRPDTRRNSTASLIAKVKEIACIPGGVHTHIKAVLTRFGIRSFRLSLRQAEARLAISARRRGTPLPDNTRAELQRLLERLSLVREQIRAIEQKRLRQLAAAPAGREGRHAMVRLIARIIGVGVETADMLVHEILSRGLRDRRAVARYAGLTGSPDESGKRRREKGLARAGSLGRIGLCADMFEAKLAADPGEGFRSVARAVVGHDARD
ncbi:MAG: hypothetical protein EOS28_32085 [Mesorhizobium sp.]|nr:MAG: hypothetical protein EOS28_32085 [Mesorhizobium sp.]